MFDKRILLGLVLGLALGALFSAFGRNGQSPEAGAAYTPEWVIKTGVYVRSASVITCPEGKEFVLVRYSCRPINTQTDYTARIKFNRFDIDLRVLSGYSPPDSPDFVVSPSETVDLSFGGCSVEVTVIGYYRPVGAESAARNWQAYDQPKESNRHDAKL